MKPIAKVTVNWDAVESMSADRVPEFIRALQKRTLSRSTPCPPPGKTCTYVYGGPGSCPDRPGDTNYCVVEVYCSNGGGGSTPDCHWCDRC